MLSLIIAILALLFSAVLPRPAALPPDGIRPIQLPVGSGPPEISIKNGVAHIAYSADGWGQVTYRRIDAFGEQSELVDGAIRLGAGLTSISVTSFGTPAIIYSGEEPEGMTESLYIARRAGPGDWRIDRVISGIDIREHFRIMYDDNDQEQIVFYSWQPDNSRWVIYHIRRDGWGWSTKEVYSFDDSIYSITAMDAVLSVGGLHVVAAVWDIGTELFQYLYFENDNQPQVIRSAASGSWVSYYRTLVLKPDRFGGLHFISCFESYNVDDHSETYSVYGYKPTWAEWQDVGFVHQEYDQTAAQAVMAAESEFEVYQLADIGGSIALFSKSITGWIRTDNAVDGDWLESADMAVFGGSLLVVYQTREPRTLEIGD